MKDASWISEHKSYDACECQNTNSFDLSYSGRSVQCSNHPSSNEDRRTDISSMPPSDHEGASSGTIPCGSHFLVTGRGSVNELPAEQDDASGMAGHDTPLTSHAANPRNRSDKDDLDRSSPKSPTNIKHQGNMALIDGERSAEEPAAQSPQSNGSLDEYWSLSDEEIDLLLDKFLEDWEDLIGPGEEPLEYPVTDPASLSANLPLRRFTSPVPTSARQAPMPQEDDLDWYADLFDVAALSTLADVDWFAALFEV